MDSFLVKVASYVYSDVLYRFVPLYPACHLRTHYCLTETITIPFFLV